MWVTKDLQKEALVFEMADALAYLCYNSFGDK